MLIDPKRALGFFRGLVIAIVAGGCGGGGCDGCGEMGAIPGGFPEESRNANAVQLRVTEGAFDTLEADPAALIGPLLGQEGLTIDVPPSCDGDPEICCEGGVPADTCGPLNIDINEQKGDLPRLEITPVQGQQRIDVTIRARIASAAPIPITYSGFDCDISIDTALGSRDGITLDMQVSMPQDPAEATTRLDLEASDIDFEDDDVTISGDFLCEAADDLLKGIIIDLLTANISAIVDQSLGEQACVACDVVEDCGANADECLEGVCMINDRCEQRLGIAGRLAASGLLGDIGSGQLGSMDIYEVAGGYTETNAGGISIGMYSGALPFAEDRDRCGPSFPAPEPIVIPESAFFSGNIRPDTSAPFHVGIGVHQQVLNQFAHAAYESGALCINVAPGAVDLLNTDGLAPLLMPSVVDLLHGKNSPILLGLRPQSPPTIEIGPGTTMEGEGGETIIVDPLLDVRFTGLEIDFSVLVEHQPIRVMTLAADLRLPINLEINEAGEIQPVLGDIEEAISNTTISNSEALRETDEELEEKIPVLLSLALPSLLDGLGSFALPELGGMNITVAEDGILSVEDNAFLAIFADLALETATPRVITEASVDIDYSEGTPVAKLSMGGSESDLEFSYRIDGSPWSPYTRASEVSLRRSILAIRGEHTIAVRARKQGVPQSTDASPVVLSFAIDKLPEPTYFETDDPAMGGCGCNSGSGAGAGWLAALALLFLMRRPKRFRKVLAFAGLAALSGCSCGSDPTGPQCAEECLEGEVERGPTGRYSSLAAADGRVVAAGYDQKLGDVVLIERNEEGELEYRAIAGLPNELPIYEPDTYRNGLAGDGPDQGLWTSIALHQGRVFVAYVDAETGAVRLTREEEDGTLRSEVVAESAGLSGASYVSLAVSTAGVPSVAYLAHGLASDEHDGLVSEVRVANGVTEDWETEVVDTAPVSCGGLCETGLSCVNTGSIEECKAASGTCEGGCGEDAQCVDSVCLDIVPERASGELLDGVGLFAQLVHVPNGSTVLGYYNASQGSLHLATDTGSGFTATASLDDDTFDYGRWLSMVAAENNAVHLAFQDATANRLMYARFEDGVLGEPEVADDGARTNDDRAHPVGASAAITLRRDLAPVIVYQDGLTSDVDVTIRDGGSWFRETLMEGARLDGFFIDAATDGDSMWMSHYFYDRAVSPMGELEIASLVE